MTTKTTKKPTYKATNVASVRAKKFEEDIMDFTVHMYDVEGVYIGTKPKGKETLEFRNDNASKDTIMHRNDTGTPKQAYQLSNKIKEVKEFTDGVYYWIYR